jgi:hypothetical protein
MREFQFFESIVEKNFYKKVFLSMTSHHHQLSVFFFQTYFRITLYTYCNFVFTNLIQQVVIIWVWHGLYIIAIHI